MKVKNKEVGQREGKLKNAAHQLVTGIEEKFNIGKG